MIQTYLTWMTEKDYSKDNVEEVVKLSDHLADKAESVLAERKATKDRIVEMIKSHKSQEQKGMYNNAWMVWCTKEDTLNTIISKIEEEYE